MLGQSLSIALFALAVMLGCGKGGDSIKPALQDTTPPVITAGPTVRSVTQNSVTITWFTDDVSTSIVEYSTDTGFGVSASTTTVVTDHSVNLTGLSAGTTYRFRVQSTNAVNLTTVSPAETFTTLSGSPAPSARIAFVTNRDGNSEIYVMDIDGTNQVRLTNTSYEEMHPAWSPDRTKIAYVSFVPDHLGTENKSIAVMNANGTGVKVLTLTTFDLHPTWAPDGRIAFSRYVGEPKNYDIFVMDGDGFNAHPIMYEDGRDDEPDWSPDGTKIAFVGTRDGYSEVFVMNADGGGRTPLTQDSVMVRSPRWSPDGTRIAYNRSYATDLGIERDIVIINADGSNPIRVTHNPDHVGEVCWTPDGNHFVYGTIQHTDIHRVDVDGSNDVNLTNSASREYQPDCR